MTGIELNVESEERSLSLIKKWLRAKYQKAAVDIQATTHVTTSDLSVQCQVLQTHYYNQTPLYPLLIDLGQEKSGRKH